MLPEFNTGRLMPWPLAAKGFPKSYSFSIQVADVLCLWKPCHEHHQQPHWPAVKWQCHVGEMVLSVLVSSG